MERTNNYLIQAQQAKQRFLTYNQQRLEEKFRLESDAEYIYVNLLCRLYRIHRKSADFSYLDGGVWRDGNSHGEVLTLLDLLCDSRDDRRISGRWKSMASFGMHIHRNLLEDRPDAITGYFDTHPEAFRAACAALGGEQIPGGDMGYAVELFDGLKIGVLFWHGDDEFSPQIRFLWDENAAMYLRYETMYYAVGLLKRRLAEIMPQTFWVSSEL